jgi:UDP-N-acetylglucosamine:LPS N-acetylglucosamine transferase
MSVSRRRPEPARPRRGNGFPPPRVLILSAGMGAGHDQVSAELARRLRHRGMVVEAVNVWSLLPPGLGWTITAFYKLAILRAPWLYSLIYRVWFSPRGSGASVSPVVTLAGRRLSRQLEAFPPQLVVSTFHLCSQIAGWMRRTGRLEAPVASVVVDFAAHRLWVDSGVDAHLCLHQVQAERVATRGGRGVITSGPIVRPGFATDPEVREPARRALGLSESDRMILVVAGSWGAGDVVRTVQVIAADGRFRPVVVAGRNRGLERRLRAVPGARVFGWVPDMDRLVAAADVMVENAGGLSAMEAIAAGVPVVSFGPIPGHGRENVEVMAEAGISALAADDACLIAWLEQLASDSPARRRMRAAGQAMMAGDAAEVLADLVRSEQPAWVTGEVTGPPGYRRRRWQSMVTRN